MTTAAGKIRKENLEELRYAFYGIDAISELIFKGLNARVNMDEESLAEAVSDVTVENLAYGIKALSTFAQMKADDLMESIEVKS